MRSRRFVEALAAGALWALAGAAGAVEFTDGFLSVDIGNDGGFDSVFLDGIQVDGSPDVQQVVGTCTFFSNASDLVIDGPTATYTGECGANFAVEVTSILLGPAPGLSGLTAVLDQTLVFTNTSGGDAPLEVLTEVDPNLAQSFDDTGFYDAGVLTFEDPSEPVSMMATASTPDVAVFGWDIAAFGHSTFFPTMNRSGPVGPDDVAGVVGYDFGSVPDQEVRSVTFTYTFQVDTLPPDNFLCFKMKGIKGKDTESLSDRFESGSFQVTKFKTFCTPVDIEGEGVVDSTTFLSGFKLKGPHAKQSRVSLENRFGTFAFDTKKTDSLLVPSEVFLASESDVFYRCLKAKRSKGEPKLPKGTSAVLDDLVGTRTGTLKKPTKICVPTSLGGGPVPTVPVHLVCYKMKASPKNKSYVVDILNEFGSGEITLKKEAELCVGALEAGTP